MSTPTRSDAYAIEVSDQELDRLVTLAATQDANVRDGFRRTTIGPGARVVDIGCGPLGGLLALSEIVGPEGVTVGIDMDGASLARARTALDRQGRHAVQLISANINELDPASLCPPGPFDAAFCRLVLMHQTDPAATLRRIAALVRPGGYVVAHEWLPLSRDISVPDAPEIQAVSDLWAAVMRARGAHPYVSTWLPRLCREAGLEEIGVRGFFQNAATTPSWVFDIFRVVTLSFRAAAIEHGIATSDEVDAMVSALDTAATREYDLLHACLFMELVAQVPDSAG